MNFSMSLYRYSPIFVKSFLLNMKAASNSKKRYRSPYEELLEKHKRLWYENIHALKEFQKNELIKLLLEAYDYSAWYQGKFSEKDITREDIINQPFSVLSKLPWLSKTDRKTNLDEIISNNQNRKIVDVGFTSGSTGEPTRVPRDQEAVSRTFALLDRYEWTIGASQRRPSVRLSGRHVINPEQQRPPFWVHNRFTKQLFISTYHLNDACLPDIIKKINDFRPETIDGYPSATYAISKYILDNNIQLGFSPIAISSTAETLHPYQRDMIEQAFKCKVFNQYASGEGSPFISECTEGNLHLHIDTGVFEFFNDKGEKAAPGEIAEMVVTSFRNFLVPLIRYRIGDMVTLNESNKKCDCGCQMPVIHNILGRDGDLVVATNGALIGMATNRIFTGIDHVLKSQVIQPTLKKLILRFVPDVGYSQSEENKIIKKAKIIFGETMSIDIQLVHDIPRGPNGKYRSVIREFPL